MPTRSAVHRTPHPEHVKRIVRPEQTIAPKFSVKISARVGGAAGPAAIPVWEVKVKRSEREPALATGRRVARGECGE
jgi:hypothetical protein